MSKTLDEVAARLEAMIAEASSPIKAIDAFEASDEWRALVRFGEILDAATTDPCISKSENVKGFVEYFADVFRGRWRELMAGNAAGALREVVHERNREIASRPRADISREELLAYRNEFVARHGSERGWKKSAQAAFNIGPKPLKRRLDGR